MSFGTPQELNLGVGNISSQIQVITAIQNDNDIPLKISLYEIKDKTKTNIPVPQTGYSIRLDTVNPNGVSKPLTCAINDDGTIETSLPNTVLSVIGCVECQLVIKGSDNSRRSSENFQIEVQETLMNS